MNNVDVLYTEEIDNLIEAISKLQIIFNPEYMISGSINAETFVKLEHTNSKKIILIDSNLFSYLYEIAKNGYCNNLKNEKIIAIVVAFSKLIDAEINPLISLYENDNNNSSISSSDKLLYCKSLIMNTGIRYWLDIAEGLNNKEKVSIESFVYTKDKYNIIDYHQLMHKISVIKIVCMYRLNRKLNFELFIDFLNWYIDHLIISDELIIYAAFLFSNFENMSLPKNCNSNDYNKVMNGINNQAWDLAQISVWSTFYWNESKENSIYFFATNDNNLRRIIVDSLHHERVYDTLRIIFNTKKQREQLEFIVNSKIVNNRIPPFDVKDKEKSKRYIDNLYKLVENDLKDLIAPK